MRAASLGLMLAGALMVVAAIAGSLGAFGRAPAATTVAGGGPGTGPGATPTGAAASLGRATTAPPPATAAPTPAPTISAVDMVTRFALDLGEAFRTGNAAFLEARLDPRVKVRYAPADCTAYLSRAANPTYRIEVQGVDGPAVWAWETDGRSEQIPGTYSVRVRVAQDGSTFVSSVAHFVIADGVVRWFTDCGTPVG